MHRGLIWMMASVVMTALAACDGTSADLRKVDPLTTPADRLRVAIEVPQEISPVEDKVMLAGVVRPKEGTETRR